MNKIKEFFIKLRLMEEVLASSGQTFANTDRHDPYRNFNFRVTIVGKKTFAQAGFQKITGLKTKTDVIEYRDGDDTQISPHKLPGLVKTDPVTFERGMSEDQDMYDWIHMQAKTSANDGDHKVTITIELLDRGRQGVKKWEMQEAWISDYETGDFDAQGNGVMVEKMVIQHEGMKLIPATSAGGDLGGTVDRA